MRNGAETRSRWLQEFALLIRQRIQSGENIPYGDFFKFAFSPPVQMIAVTPEYPSQSKAYLTHVQHLADLSIWAYEPLKLYDLLPLLEEIAADQSFEENDTERTSFRQELLSKHTVGSFLGTEFTMLLEEIQDRIFDRPGGPGFGFARYEKVQILNFQGDYLEHTPSEYLDQWKASELQFQSMFQKTSMFPTTKEDLERLLKVQEEKRKGWLGAFFFPPVRIGATQQRTVREQMSRSIGQFDLGKVVLIDSIDTVKFIATYFGYVGLKETDPIRVASKLNVLSCVILLLGTSQFVILPRELGEFNMDDSVQSFTASGVPGTERSVGNKDFALNRFNPPKMMEIEFLKRALRITEEILIDADLVQYMTLLLDSHTRLMSSEFDQAFYSAWILIEAFVNRLWEDMLGRKAISGKRLEGLKQPTEWTLNNKLETLSLLDELSKQEYELFTSLRRRRNEILHPKTRATKEDSERCYEAAKSLVEKIAAPLIKQG